MTSANDFLMASGVPSAKFELPGAYVTGTICRPPEVQQQRDFTSGEPKFWDDGKPMQQLQVQLATDQRDPATPDDDGIRAIYVKANMQKAVREAVRRSGASGLEVGGTLTVTYTGNGEASRRGINPPKLYSAVYVPAPAVAANAFLEQGEPAQPAAPQDPWANQGPQPAWSQPAPAAPAPAAVPAGVSPEALAALALLSPEQKAALGLA